jgi:hypothetical protein
MRRIPAGAGVRLVSLMAKNCLLRAPARPFAWIWRTMVAWEQDPG